MEDEAAKRREARRKEREARRAERDAEDAADEEKRKREREERRKKRDTGRDEPAEESASARRRREREEEEKRKAEEETAEQRRREEEKRREEERRRREEEEEEERRRMEEEKNRLNQDHVDADEVDEDEDEEEEEEEEETIMDRLSPQKKQAILEGLANELRRIVEEREAKSVPASQQELDELDLKLRSLRTQLRKAEENSNLLAKQKKDLEEKIKKNTNDINNLRTQVKRTEDENARLIKEGKKVAPQRAVKKTLPPKKGNFVNVVRKAQAAAWEEKFMAMKAKQKESNKMSEELMSKMNRVKRTDSPLLTGLKKDKKDKKKEEKEAAPAWAKSQLKKGGSKPWGEEKKKEGEKKPDWSGRVALKKTEKKEGVELGESKRQDWREGLKKAPKSPGVEGAGDPEWKGVSLRTTGRHDEDD